MIAATEQFTNLTSLRIDMASITSNGVKVAVSALGERLVELKAQADTICKNYLSGEVMETITSSCPNLKHFEYRSGSLESSLDGVTGDRIVSLVEGCRRLESLELSRARNVTQSHFLQIANLVANDLDGFALRKIVANGYSAIGSDSFNIQTLLAEYTFLEVKDTFVDPCWLEKGIFFTKPQKVKNAVKKAAMMEMISSLQARFPPFAESDSE